jgi:hypothetical protein
MPIHSRGPALPQDLHDLLVALGVNSDQDKLAPVIERRRNDPQQGMAQGFITLVALILLLFGGALWFGVARQHPWVVRIVFAITIFPALSQIAQEIYLLMRHAP